VNNLTPVFISHEDFHKDLLSLDEQMFGVCKRAWCVTVSRPSVCSYTDMIHVHVMALYSLIVLMSTHVL